MVDFNNFIRDDVVEPGQKDRLIQQRVMSNKNDQQLPMMKRKKQQTNLYNALVYDQHNIYAIGRVTKTLIKKAKNSLYKKDIVFVNVYNILENKKFLPEKLLLNTSFVGKKDIMRTT